jgi:antirestriction protein ArdC
MTREGQAKIYQMVTDKLVAALEAGTVPWHKPWVSVAGGLPLSMATNKAYRGINVMILGMTALASGYTSPWWGSIKKINQLGGQVRKGEHHEFAIWWNPFEIETDETDAKGRKITKKAFSLRFYRVWNADQCDGLPEKYYPKPAERTPFEVHEQAQGVFDSYTAREDIPVTYGSAGAAYYPVDDKITLPDDFYDTAFHEAVHSTGNKKRLNREGTDRPHFGSETYGKEELIAEIGGAMLCATVGVTSDHLDKNNAAYIASWLRTIKGDPKLAVKAAGAAQKATDCVLGTSFEAENGDESA